MENYLALQLIDFLLSIFLGVSLGVVYELLRLIRLKSNSVVTFILDLFFFILAGIVVFFHGVLSGNVRIYPLVGILGGFILYFYSLSKLITMLFDFIFNIVKKIQKMLYFFFEML